MVFRPTIVRGAALSGAITNDRYDYIIGREHQAGSDCMAAGLANLDSPQMGYPLTPITPLTPPPHRAVAVVPAVDAGVAPSGDTQAVGNSAIGLPTAGRAAAKIGCHTP
jgi:hypothetical protein